MKEVVTSPENADRWLITFSAYAQIDVPNAWGGWRNPVRYTTADVLGIDLSSLVFQPMPEPSIVSAEPISAHSNETSNLTIDQAKKGLSKTFGVPMESIEITIKG